MNCSNRNIDNVALHLYEKSKADSFVFSYRGPFHAELTSKFVGISEQTINSVDELKKINRKFSFLVVETFQNMLKHGGQTTAGLFGHYSFRNFKNFLSINSINLVEVDQVDHLVDMVNAINSLSEVELKTAWKSKLVNGEMSDKSGAGLGLLEIARRSGQEMNYKIEDFNDEFKKFHNQVSYLHSDLAKIDQKIDYINKTDDVNLFMREHGILFEYKGKINQKMIFPMMNIVEHSVSHEEKGSKKIKLVSHILMEMLQNIPITKIGNNNFRDGVCVVQKSNKDFILSTGNIVNKANLPKLKIRLDVLKSMSVNELKVLHFQRMKEVVTSAQKDSSQLGLIEIARFCNGRLGYEFVEVDEDHVFFTLKATI